MLGSPSIPYAFQRRYNRLLLAAWAVAMLGLTFVWWKALSGKGIVSFSCPAARVEATILSGRGYLTVVSGGNGWEAYGFYSPEDGTVFRGTIDDILKGRRRVQVGTPFWLLMLVVSLGFAAVWWIQKRRWRRWKMGLPGDFAKSQIESAL